MARVFEGGAKSGPLHLAAVEGDEVTARQLIEGGACIDTKDRGGKTPLHWAAKSGDEGTFNGQL
jgi:ankyrin repeat protein